MQPWFDTHVHLDRYGAGERVLLLERAEEAGVQMIGVGVDLASSLAISEMAELCGSVVGVHPRHAGSGVPPEFAKLARHSRVIAIGECGFDDEGAEWPAQARVVRSLCQLARAERLPLVLHVDGQRAWDELVANEDALSGLTVVRHYFTGDAAQARWHAERGHFVSFGNPLRRIRALRDIAIEYPPNRLLIETDSYPLPGRTTEPKDVAKVGETLALLREWTFEEARERLAANTRTAFPKLR